MKYQLEASLDLSQHPFDPNKMVATTFITPKTLEMVEEPKHVVFLVDHSGSMSGQPIEMVKTALIQYIEGGLGEKDVFSVVLFSSEASLLLNQVKAGDIDTPLSGTTSTPRLLCQSIKATNNTHMEKAIALIGSSDFPIEDASNLHIVLLTDGENSAPLVHKSIVEDLVSKMPGNICPRIYPVGIGTGYNEESIATFGDLTQVKQRFHISEPDDIPVVFQAVQKNIRPCTKEKISFILYIGETTHQAELGSIPFDLRTSYTFEINKGTLQSENYIIHGPDGSILLEETFSLDALVYNKDAAAAIAKEKLEAIVRANKACISDSDSPYDIQQRKAFAQQLQDEVLPLIGAESITDSDFVKQVRQLIIHSIEIYQADELDVNAARAVKAGGTQINQGAMTSVGISRQARRNAGTFDETTGQLTIGMDSYTILSQTVDFVTNSAKLLSLDPINKREAILIDPESQMVADIRKEMKDTSLAAVVACVNDYFTGSAVSNIEATGSYMGSKDRIYTIPLDEFLKEKQGLCRHKMPLTALLIAHLIKEGNLPDGSVRQYRGLSINGNLAHTWVVYHDRVHGCHYLIDPLNPSKQIYNLTKECAKARRDYENRGLTGILDACLGSLGYLADQAAINPEVVDKVPLEVQESFVEEGLTCPITCDIMLKPVRIKGEDPKHVLDEESALAWFNVKNTNPYTGLPCSMELIPAVDVRNHIIIKCLGEELPPETYSAALTTQLVSADKRVQGDELHSLLIKRKGQINRGLTRVLKDGIPANALKHTAADTSLTIELSESKTVTKEQTVKEKVVKVVPASAAKLQTTTTTPVVPASAAKSQTTTTTQATVPLAAGTGKKTPASTPTKGTGVFDHEIPLTPLQPAKKGKKPKIPNADDINTFETYAHTRQMETIIGGFKAYCRNLVRLNEAAKVAAAQKVVRLLRGEKDIYFTKLDWDALTEEGSTLAGHVNSCALAKQIIYDATVKKSDTDPVKALKDYVEMRHTESCLCNFFANRARLDEVVKTDAAEKLIDYLLSDDESKPTFSAVDIEALTEDGSRLGNLVETFYSMWVLPPEIDEIITARRDALDVSV